MLWTVFLGWIPVEYPGLCTYFPKEKKIIFVLIQKSMYMICMLYILPIKQPETKSGSVSKNLGLKS